MDLQSLQLALDMQSMRLRKKKRQNIRPVPGSLFLAKTSGVPRVALREAVRGRCPVQHTQKQVGQHGMKSRESSHSCSDSDDARTKDRTFLSFSSCMDTECISACVRSAARMQSLFVFTANTFSNVRRWQLEFSLLMGAGSSPGRMAGLGKKSSTGSDILHYN